MKTRKPSNSKSSEGSEDFDAAYLRAIRMLRTRDRFAAEVRAELVKRSEPETVDAVVARLQGRGILNDRRAVESLIAANVGKGVRSIEALRQKCAALGAAGEALSLLDEVRSPDPATLISRYEPTPKGRARAFRFLLSRGFDEEAARSAVETRLGPELTPES